MAQIDVIKLVIPENADLEIPQWHKEIVRQRVATATEKGFTEMSQVFSKIDFGIMPHQKYIVIFLNDAIVQFQQSIHY